MREKHQHQLSTSSMSLAGDWAWNLAFALNMTSWCIGQCPTPVPHWLMERSTFEDGGRSPEWRNARNAVLDAWKGQESDFPPEPGEEDTWWVGTLVSAQFSLQSYKGIHFCCFEPVVCKPPQFAALLTSDFADHYFKLPVCGNLLQKL